MSNMKDIADMVRSVIERQIATTPSGKKLTAFDEAAVANLVTNIVGNLTMAVVNEIEEHVEEAIEIGVAA